MNILCICKHNRFRSKLSEYFIRRYAPDTWVIKSAGIKYDLADPLVHANVLAELKTRGIDDVDRVPHVVSDELISWADLIIVAADNVDSSRFPEDKTEVWPIHDCDQDDRSCIADRAAFIEKQAENLVARFRKHR